MRRHAIAIGVEEPLTQMKLLLKYCYLKLLLPRPNACLADTSVALISSSCNEKVILPSDGYNVNFVNNTHILTNKPEVIPNS